MATLLDIQGISFLSSIFTFILVFAVLYAMMEFTKTLGESKNLHALISFSIAVLVMFSKDSISVINYITPWFVIMFIFILLVLMSVQMFGISSGSIIDFIKKSDYGPTIMYWIITIAVIILLLGLSNTYGQKVGPYLGNETDTNTASGFADNTRGDGTVATGDFSQNLGATLFHPRILGLILIMLIGAFAVLLLARSEAS